eukprot:COSAG02_NODE_185_length_30442_cov_59.370168_10_plen_74_part_00
MVRIDSLGLPLHLHNVIHSTNPLCQYHIRQIKSKAWAAAQPVVVAEGSAARVRLGRAVQRRVGAWPRLLAGYC